MYSYGGKVEGGLSMKTSVKKSAQEIYPISLPTPFLVGPVNTYLIKGEALTLVDTGPFTKETETKLEYELGVLGFSMKDIELVILTHHHPDHIGLVHKFMPYAKIAGHPKLKPWLKKDKDFLERTMEFYTEMYFSHGVPEKWIEKMRQKNEQFMTFTEKAELSTELIEGSQIEGLSGWTVMETPGHAQSHISLFREKDGTMIAGDHVIEHISSNAIIEAPYQHGEERPKTLLQYRDSLKRCLTSNYIYSGHGKTIENPKELIQKRLDDQLGKAFSFKRKMGKGPIQVFDLCKEVYPQLYQKQTSLTFSETLGHLDLLEEKSEVGWEKVDGKILYQVK